jgi:hypothetical protein
MPPAKETTGSFGRVPTWRRATALPVRHRQRRARRRRATAPALRILHGSRVAFDLMLASDARAKGALVMWELAAESEASLRDAAFALAHVVKYAVDRSEGLLPGRPGEVSLEICTLESQGLRFRSWLPNTKVASWTVLPSFSISAVVDSCGAGDRCTAGGALAYRPPRLLRVREHNARSIAVGASTGQSHGCLELSVCWCPGWYVPSNADARGRRYRGDPSRRPKAS